MIDTNEINKKDYSNKGWSYALNTPIVLNNIKCLVRLGEGMTGIGSRSLYINDKQFCINNCVIQSEDLTKGKHFLYRINWRENPWDKVYIIISEEELPFLLDKEKQPEWRNPVAIETSL